MSLSAAESALGKAGIAFHEESDTGFEPPPAPGAGTITEYTSYMLNLGSEPPGGTFQTAHFDWAQRICSVQFCSNVPTREEALTQLAALSSTYGPPASDHEDPGPLHERDVTWQSSTTLLKWSVLSVSDGAHEPTFSACEEYEPSTSNGCPVQIPSAP
jgi:hypothetical protein